MMLSSKIAVFMKIIELHSKTTILSLSKTDKNLSDFLVWTYTMK